MIKKTIFCMSIWLVGVCHVTYLSAAASNIHTLGKKEPRAVIIPETRCMAKKKVWFNAWRLTVHHADQSHPQEVVQGTFECIRASSRRNRLAFHLAIGCTCLAGIWKAHEKYPFASSLAGVVVISVIMQTIYSYWYAVPFNDAIVCELDAFVVEDYGKIPDDLVWYLISFSPLKNTRSGTSTDLPTNDPPKFNVHTPSSPLAPVGDSSLPVSPKSVSPGHMLNPGPTDQERRNALRSVARLAALGVREKRSSNNGPILYNILRSDTVSVAFKNSTTQVI